MHDGGRYQGRQYHMWFGHGTKPKDDVGSLDHRIGSRADTMIAGLPESKRYHNAARFSEIERGRLNRLLHAVIRALPLGPRMTTIRVLGRHPDARGAASFIEAGRILNAVTSSHVQVHINYHTKDGQKATVYVRG